MTHIHLDIVAVASNYMWFIPLTNELLDDDGNLVDAAHPVAYQSLNYDFERRPNDVWLLHIDVGLRVRPVAEIKVRVTFQTVYKGPLEHILNIAAMHDVVTIAMDNCLRGFNERCEAVGIAYRHQKIDLIIPNALEHVRNSYVNEHKSLEGTWAANTFATFTPGRKTLLLCKIPFMIMDKVFFSDSEFEHRHNASLLFEHVPESFYYTIKLRCNTIDKETVELSGTHSVFYLICLDCALQLLVGDHADRFGSLVGQGLTPETRKNFLAWGTEYFNYYRKHLDEKGAHITNFDNRPNWNAVIR